MQSKIVARSGFPALLLFSLVLALAPTRGPAQDASALPVVTLRATDPYAAEVCGPLTVVFPARFTVQRSQGTNFPLVVYYSIGGTASNGVDYVTISNAVTIPTGAWSADVPIYPRGDDLIEGTETVVLRLLGMNCTNSSATSAKCYLVGQPCEAVAFIEDCVPSNLPPLVRIVEPGAGAKFRAPADIRILADTVDRDGYVGLVEFFDGARKIGEQSKLFYVPPTNGTPIPYEMTWSNVPPGSYVLTARATDARGGVGTSPPVPIYVVTVVPPPNTNPPPVVTIVATDPLAIEGTNCWPWSNPTNRWILGTTNCVTIGANTGPIWWFTNCGPKNATITVRRTGDTNAELLVHYTVSGTATNGRDYDALPGFVRIPAGARRADISVVPRLDNVPEPNETVILRLTPLPVLDCSRPPYLIGYPKCAGAIIVDSARPRPLPWAAALPDRCVWVGQAALDGTWYWVECSADLRTWVPVCTNQAVQGELHFVDPEAQSGASRFYRAVLSTTPTD